MEKLAIFGGKPVVHIPHPHEKWPPDAKADELKEIASQRNIDISLKGRSGIVLELEDEFKKFMDQQVEYVITFNSGTSALLAAYFALGITDGDEVIGPCLTYHAALSPMFILGAKPVLVDIDVITRGINPEKIEESITRKTKAITVVHQWGHPVDIEDVLSIAKKYNLYVIEDCSHAHGSKYKGKLCGTFGDVAIFSLQANKAVFAGEGGVLVTNNTDVHDKATLLGHYRDRSRDEVKNSKLNQYWVTGFGQKMRMSTLNAVVAIHSLRNFGEIKKGRHQCLSYFNKRLEETECVKPLEMKSYIDIGAWYGFKPLFNPEKIEGIPRSVFIKALQQEGVEVNAPSAPILSRLPLFYEKNPFTIKESEKRMVNYEERYPVASYVEANALSLPTFYSWKDHKDTINQYIEAIIKVRRNAKQLKQ